jgi:hypothetical protein
MNTYLIPVTEPYGYNYDYFALVHAATPQEAYTLAKQIPDLASHLQLADKNFSHYIKFEGTLDIPKDKILYANQKNDIMMSLLIQQNKLKQLNYQKQHQNQCGDDIMTDLLYDFIYMKDYNQNITDLASMAIQESWSLSEEENNSILKRYLSRTLERLQEENKIVFTDNFCAFNTGLFTPNYESIYLLAERKIENENEYPKKDWIFKEFCTEYDLGSTDITNLPERADYFTDPSLLIFDWHYPVRVQYGHILDSERNKRRLPKSIADSKMKLQLFTGVIDTSIKKVIANYKLAVPQYYEGEIQLLIPLFFENDNKPDLALTVTKKDGYYQGHTCLTLDMAYNNARLIAKPENNWLANI